MPLHRTLVRALAALLLGGVAHADDGGPEPSAEASGQPMAPSVKAWRAARDAYWRGDADAEALLVEVAQSPTASAILRRDASHLLGRLLLERARPDTGDDAVSAWREALGLGLSPEAPSHLDDLLRYGLARALIERGHGDEEPLGLLAAVEEDPHSPLRADAAFLRARYLDVLGRPEQAKRAYQVVLERWPEAVFADEVRTRLGSLEVARGRARPAHPSDEALLASLGAGGSPDGRVPLDHIRFLVRERRFDLVGPALAPWLVEPPRGAPKSAVDAWLDALEIALDDQWENFRFDEALATSAKLRKNKREGLSKARETRLYALDGDFDKARAQLKKRLRGKAYFSALGDLAYEFARYEEAYEAYVKVVGKKAAPTERMVWCLLRMGKADKAAKHWEKLGKTRGFNKNLFERYWYARAQQLAGKPSAQALFEALVEDAPLEYYGLQAWSRLQEMAGSVPAAAAPPVLAVPRKGDEPLVGTPTIAWSEPALRGAFERAPRPAPLAEIEPVSQAFAASWGDVAEEARRADELVGLGDLSAAVSELRVIDMDLRAMRMKGANLGARARSDLLDNRGTPRARGGASMKEEGKTRKTAEQAAAMKRRADGLKRDLRRLQLLLADPYAMRRAVLEGHSKMTPELLAERGTALYPLAYPEIVSTLATQLGLPPYFVYAVMTVESAFHPGAVSVASAYGLVQVIPRTGENLARELGFVGFTPERLLEPPVSIYFGGYYLARLLARFHGQEPLAAAAYNAGPHRVATWLMARGTIPLDMFIEDIPYDQARGYTKTVLEHIAAYRRIYHGEEHLYIRNTIDPTMGDAPNY